MVSICCRNSSRSTSGSSSSPARTACSAIGRSGDPSRGRRASAPPRRRSCEWPRQPVPRLRGVQSVAGVSAAERFGRLAAMLPRALVALACFVLLAGCGDDAPLDEPTPQAELSPTATVAPPFDGRLEPAEAVLALVPTTATTLTVTDFDTIRVQLGVPDLTSADSMTDALGVLGASRAGDRAADRRVAARRQLRADAGLRVHPGRRGLGGPLHRTGGEGLRDPVPPRPAAGRRHPGGQGGCRSTRRSPGHAGGPPGRVGYGGRGRAGLGERAGLGLAGRRAGRLDVRAPGLHPGQRRPRGRRPTPSTSRPWTRRTRCTSSTTCRRSRSRSATTWRRSGWGRTATTCSPGSTSAGTGRCGTSRRRSVRRWATRRPAGSATPCRGHPRRPR